MARRVSWPAERWEQEGVDAIVDLVQERLVVPWAEAEARIAAGWKDFRKVQPLQLHGARRRLRGESPPRVIEESTQQVPPVTTLRIPFPEGQKRELERLRGAKRKLYRRYQAWTGDEGLCGKQGERVVFESLKAASSDAGLWVPPQTLGHVAEVRRVPTPHGPLDVRAEVLDIDRLVPVAEVPLVVEVKNLHTWLYPWTREVWELLIKAASVAVTTPVVPLIACPFSAWTTFLLAQDIGFLSCPYGTQVFSPRVDATEFDEVAFEFGLPISRHDGPLDSMVTWLGRHLRESPPPSGRGAGPPPGLPLTQPLPV